MRRLREITKGRRRAPTNASPAVMQLATSPMAMPEETEPPASTAAKTTQSTKTSTTAERPVETPAVTHTRDALKKRDSASKHKPSSPETGFTGASGFQRGIGGSKRRLLGKSDYKTGWER